MTGLLKGLVPESKAYIDLNTFKPIDEHVVRLMRDCGMCVAISWSFLDLRTDILGSLPKDASRVAWAAVDPLERGYCVSIYQTQHPSWPGRVFTFAVASKDERSYIYESPSGEPVPMAVLLKNIAEQQTFWSWHSQMGRIYKILISLFVAVGLGSFITAAVRGDIWIAVTFALLCFIVMPAFILTMPPRSHNKAVRELRQEVAGF